MTICIRPNSNIQTNRSKNLTIVVIACSAVDCIDVMNEVRPLHPAIRVPMQSQTHAYQPQMRSSQRIRLWLEFNVLGTQVCACFPERTAAVQFARFSNCGAYDMYESTSSSYQHSPRALPTHIRGAHREPPRRVVWLGFKVIFGWGSSTICSSIFVPYYYTRYHVYIRNHTPHTENDTPVIIMDVSNDTEDFRPGCTRYHTPKVCAAYIHEPPLLFITRVAASTHGHSQHSTEHLRAGKHPAWRPLTK